MKFFAIAILLLALAMPASGKTYKSTYPVPCGEVWTAVTDVLSSPDEYNVTAKDDAKMTADYHPKHKVHATITGAALQRTNHVTLIPKGETCEMHVVSNYSGFEHNDRDDFKKRVDDALAKHKNTPAEVPNKPEDFFR